jgi:hypothetical protein
VAWGSVCRKRGNSREIKCEILGSHDGDCEDYYFMGCDAGKKFTDVSEVPAASIFREESLFSYPTDRDSTFLQNSGKFLPDYTVSHSTRQHSL